MTYRLVFIIVIASCLAACTSVEKRAQELLETARFEEKQGNREHARKLYDEIARSYPASPAARESIERLKALSAP